MKKIWKKPELVVLGRSRPEESVLAFCKTGGVTAADPGGSHSGCTTYSATDCGQEADCYKCCAAPTS